MSTFPAALDLTALNSSEGLVLTLPAGQRSGLGSAVASAGDLNGDGIADLAVGAPSNGTTYVVFGTRSGFTAKIDLSKLDGQTGFALTGPANSQSGSSVSSAGEVNGDGVADLIIGAPNADRGAGTAYVVFGSRTGLDPVLDLTKLDGRNGFSLKGPAASLSG